MSCFKDLRIVDNFYQTSAFFPMPTLAIATLDEEGNTSLGSYSLCFPYYVAGKDYYAMLLECRNNSNTAQNILRTGKCSLNFIQDNKKHFKELVRLGFPGEQSKDKMKDCLFTLVKGQSEGVRPLIIDEAYQVMECSWDNSLEGAMDDKAGQLEGYEPPYHSFNGITSRYGAHFILKIDKILIKEKFYNAIVNGVKASSFPRVPVDYGYRDSTSFWYTKFKRPIRQGIPAGKEADLQSVVYAANRMDPNVKFTNSACKTLVKVPRVFLKLALKGCVDYAQKNNISVIDEDTMKIINDKRNREKN